MKPAWLDPYAPGVAGAGGWVEMCAAEDKSGGTDERLHERPFRILLAEDDRELRQLLSWCLRTEGYDVVECANGSDLLDYLLAFLHTGDGADFRLILSDIRMPGSTGLGVLEAASQRSGFPPLILITPFGDEPLDDQARRLGLIAFPEKPTEIEKLVSKAREVAPITIQVSEGS